LDKISHWFRALRSPNYRLYFIGQGISLIGSWMQMLAMSWLVYRLTHSSLLLGVFGFTTQIPMFLLGPVAGVLADRWNRHRMLITTQALLMIQAGLLSLLVLGHWITEWHIVALGMFLGLVNAFDMPVRHAFVPQLVRTKEELSNAIALNSILFNGARFVGPSIAGMLVATVGEGICFALNAVSYLAVIGALLAMRGILDPPPKPGSKIQGELRKGLAYAYHCLPIRATLLLVALVSFLGMSYQVLLPIFAQEILKGGPHTLGFLMSAMGAGAMVAAMHLASRKSVLGLESIIPQGTLIFGLGLILFSLSRSLPLSLFLIGFIGFGMMTQMVASNTLIQTVVDEDKRGRIMSLYTTAFMGIAPFGSLFSGALAHKIGTPRAVLVGGISCAIGALLFLKSLPKIRQWTESEFHKK